MGLFEHTPQLPPEDQRRHTLLEQLVAHIAHKPIGIRSAVKDSPVASDFLCDCAYDGQPYEFPNDDQANQTVLYFWDNTKPIGMSENYQHGRE